MGKNDDVIIKIATMLIKRTFKDSEKSKKLDIIKMQSIPMLLSIKKIDDFR